MPRTLVELLHLRAAQRPAKPAFTLLADGAPDDVQLSYADLDRRARAIAALLQQHVRAGQRALLLYPHGLEFVTAFFGCLYAGVVAVPAATPDASRMVRALPRLRAIVEDAGASLVLTTSETHAMITQSLESRELAPGALRYLETDQTVPGAEGSWRDPGGDRDSLAFLQYTSGSTTAPKGVVLTHGNLLANLEVIHRCFPQDENSIAVSWLPLFHDMGLIGKVLYAIDVGMTCHLMSPMAFLRRPLRWLQAISRLRATYSGAPNFAYDLATRRITDEQCAALDLSSWTLAFNGSEPVHPATLRSFADKFAVAGFRWEAFSPCYGLAEATLQVSGSLKGSAPVELTVDAADLEQHRVTPRMDGRTLIGCGEAPPTVVIVDIDRGERCSDDQVGEIWVRGPSVARGYWNKDELSAEVFDARLAGEGPFLRTGDLGFVHGGELFVTGRIKDVIIIAGRNHYPHDLELTVETCHPSLRPGGAAAFSIQAGESEALVVLVEAGAAADAPGIIRAIRRALVEGHELHAQFVRLVPRGSLPRTTSGKLQRRAARAAFLSGQLGAD